MAIRHVQGGSVAVAMAMAMLVIVMMFFKTAMSAGTVTSGALCSVRES